MTEQALKSCTDCKYYQLIRHGGDYYEPPTFEWECENESETETTNFIQSWGLAAANHCPLYEVRMIEDCPSCGTGINHPYMTWKTWCTSWGPSIAVCSPECVEKEDREAQYYYQKIVQEDPDFDSSQTRG